jgi:hypothetical protein
VTRHDYRHIRGEQAMRDAADEFRSWVRDHHPDLEEVIWPDPSAPLPLTVTGAEALQSVLDAWLEQR